MVDVRDYHRAQDLADELLDYCRKNGAIEAAGIKQTIKVDGLTAERTADQLNHRLTKNLSLAERMHLVAILAASIAREAGKA